MIETPDQKRAIIVYLDYPLKDPNPWERFLLASGTIVIWTRHA